MTEEELRKIKNMNVLKLKSTKSAIILLKSANEHRPKVDNERVLVTCGHQGVKYSPESYTERQKFIEKKI